MICRIGSLASRDAVLLSPLLFLEKISCPAAIMSESRDSGCNPGFEGRAKSREIVNHSRTILGRNSGHVPDSRSGLKIGDSQGLDHAHVSHRSEEHTSELQSRSDLVCRLLLEKKNNR